LSIIITIITVTMEEPVPLSAADTLADQEVLGTKKPTSEDATDIDDNSAAASDSSSSSSSVSSSSSGSSSTSSTSSRNTSFEEKKEQEQEPQPAETNTETKTEPLVPLDADVDTEEKEQTSSEQEGGAGVETLQKLRDRVSISKIKLADQRTLALDRLREQESKTEDKEEEVLYWKQKYEDLVAVSAAAKQENDNDDEVQAASWERKLQEAQTEWEARRDREEERRTQAAIDEGLSAASEQLEQILGEAEREIQALTEKNGQLKADAVLYGKLMPKHEELESLLQSKDTEIGKLQDALREKTEEAARALKDHQDLVQVQSQAPQEATDSSSGSTNSNDPEQDNKNAADLFRQNAELQEQNKELRAEQEKKTKALEAKIKEVKDRAMTRLRQISLLERKLMESAKESKLLRAKVKKLEDHCLAVKKESKERRRESHKVKRDLQKALKRIKELLSLQAEQNVTAAAAAPANANATVDEEEKSSTTENKDLTISVLTWTGDLVEIKDITIETSIDEIKEIIADEKSIDEERQTLFNKAGTELSDDWRTLGGYGIRDGDTLMLDNPQKKSLKINVLTWSGDLLEIDDVSSTMSMDKIQEKIAARTSVSIDRQTLLLKGGAKVSNRSLKSAGSMRSVGSLRSLGSSMNFSNHSQRSQRSMRSTRSPRSQKSVRSLGLYGIQDGDTLMLDNPEKENLKIDVITWTGDLVNIKDISTETTVEELKEKIAVETSASKDDQKLKNGTTELYFNHRSLGDYGIRTGDTLMLDIPEKKKVPVVVEKTPAIPKDVTISVLTWTGDMVEIEDISNDVSIDVIKDKIAEESSVSKDKQLLMKGPTELSDNQKSLSDYGIQDDVTLMLANPEKKLAADEKPSTPEITNITISVLTWTGNLVEIVDVNSETSIDELKDKIAVETSVSKDKQKLMKGSTELQYDRRLLGSYEIKDGDTLMLDNPEKKVTKGGGFWGWGN